MHMLTFKCNSSMIGWSCLLPRTCSLAFTNRATKGRFTIPIGLSRKKHAELTWPFREDDEATNDDNEIEIEIDDPSKSVEHEKRKRTIETSTSKL